MYLLPLFDCNGYVYWTFALSIVYDVHSVFIVDISHSLFLCLILCLSSLLKDYYNHSIIVYIALPLSPSRTFSWPYSEYRNACKVYVTYIINNYMDLTSHTLSTRCFFLFYACCPLSCVSLPFSHSHPTRTITLALSETLFHPPSLCHIPAISSTRTKKAKRKERKKNIMKYL